jgi:23S rRNA pseudouridine1911/1915/1917 synthase
MEYQANQNTSLTEILSLLAPGSSKSSQRNWVKVGRVTIDGRLVSRFDTPVLQGQHVRLAHKSKPLPQHLRILYEDKHLVVVEKPRGLLSVATHFETQRTAHGILKEYYAPQRVYVIHRLDQDTSGVMLFGLSEEGFRGLKEDFKTHSLQRL